MKKYAISLLTIAIAISIMVVLGWAEYNERKSFERMAKQSLPTQRWEYGGGRWTDAFAMILSGGIIVSQIYVIHKTMKNAQLRVFSSIAIMRQNKIIR
jgi:hypothetical protein